MAVESINPQLCSGCGACVLCWPADVVGMDKTLKLPVVWYPEECVVCCWCVAECPTDAITLTPKRTARLFTSWG